MRCDFKKSLLLDVVSEKRQVEDQCQPVSIDKEEKGQHTVDGGFGDDVGVETVAQVDRIDVVTVASSC